jgi:predicted GH43/DUF377 family glycosyl hydrolase
MTATAWWPILEGQGDVLTDMSGNAHSGTINGALWTKLPSGWALDFNGSSDYVAVANHADFALPGTYTLMAWIKGTHAASTYHSIIDKRNAWNMRIYNQRLYMRQIDAVIGTKTIQSQPYITDEEWTHVAVTYDSSLASEAKVIADANSFKVQAGGPVVAVGAAGKWDTVHREIGNVIYDIEELDADRRYKMVYSGYTGTYAQNNVYIGVAFSPDGATWTKYTVDAPIIADSGEDPYVVKVGATYYLYTEYKEAVPFVGIRCYTSDDFINWVDNGYVLSPLEDGGWESTDVSSPAVLVEDGVWYMYYEGRGPGNGGLIGLATSTDGLTFTRYQTSPLVASVAEWDGLAQVPDDILALGGVYWMMYHGLNSEGWRSGLVYSYDRITWYSHPLNPIDSSDTLMLMPVYGVANPAAQPVFGFIADASGISRYQSWYTPAPHLFINGARVQSLNRPDWEGTTPRAYSQALALGASNLDNNYWYNGLIRDVRIYRSTLSEAQIFSSFSGGPESFTQPCAPGPCRPSPGPNARNRR